MAVRRGRYPSEFKERVWELVRAGVATEWLRAGVARSGWRSMSCGTRMPRFLGNWLAFLLVALACDQASPRASHTQLVTTTDSAGVVVIESSHPQWPSQYGWTVATEPEFTIGASGFEQQGILFGSITTMEVLSSGRLAVADPQSATVSVFDTTGVFLHSFGGRGQGPGEFDGIWDLFACAADTVMVGFRSELSVFDGQPAGLEGGLLSAQACRMESPAWESKPYMMTVVISSPAQRSRTPSLGEAGFDRSS